MLRKGWSGWLTGLAGGVGWRGGGRLAGGGLGGGGVLAGGAGEGVCGAWRWRKGWVWLEGGLEGGLAGGGECINTKTCGFKLVFYTTPLAVAGWPPSTYLKNVTVNLNP